MGGLHNSIFYKVTYRMLMKNKVRTIVTILGIVLSTALITAIATFVSSMHHSMLEYKISEMGNWHGAVMAVDDVTADRIMSDRQVISSCSLYNLGYMKLENPASEYKPYLNVEAADDTFISKMPVTVTSGRMPENSSEILIPISLSDDDQADDQKAYELGRKITLQLGERVDADGNAVNQANEFSEDDAKYSVELPSSVKEESLTNVKTTQYTIVGFYQRPSFESYDEPGYTLLTVHDQKTSYYGRTVFFQLKNASNVYSYLKNFDATHITRTNSAVLSLLGVMRYSGILSAIYGLSAIVIVLVMLGSVFLIYSSFAISVNERSHQFGLLSSIGATRAQLRKSVLFEAMFVSVIGIPTGIIAGIAGIAVTLYCIRGSIKLLTTKVISLGNLKLYVSWEAIVIAVIVAAVTVLLSNMIPVIRIARLSAIEAVRGNQDVRIKARKVKCSWLFYKIFGFEGMLARKNFKRSRKKYRVTVLTLFVSVVLFISAEALGWYMMKSVDELYKTNDYQITYSSEGDHLDASLYEQMKDVPGVTQTGIAKKQSVTVTYNKADLSKEYLDILVNQKNTIVTEMSDTVSYHINLYVVDDDTYRDYLVQNHLSTEKYMNPEQPLMIAFARYRQKDQSAGKITMIDIFNKQNVKVQASETDTEKQKKLYEEYKEQLTLQSNATSEEIQSRSDLYKSLQEQSGFTFDINIGLFTENLPFVVSANDRSSGIMVVCPDCMYNTIIEGHTINSYPTVYFKTSDHNQSYNQLKQVLDSRNLNKTMLRDIALEYESQVSIVFIIRVFSYGFIILMSLIAIANVFNTVSTNLILRQREFAMLKSIGLTEKGFNKMMYYECIMYGLKALMFGIPVSLLFTYWMYRQIDLVWSVGFHIPITAMLIAVFSVFTVVLITMMYAKRKINKLNLIDVIKNENV